MLKIKSTQHIPSTLVLLIAASIGISSLCAVNSVSIAQTPASPASSPAKSETSATATQNDIGAQLYAKAEEIFDNVTINKYSHPDGAAAGQVNFKDGHTEASTDSSGFVSYVLNSVSPKHYTTVLEMSNSGHPRARNYAQFIRSLTPNKAEHGWLHITDFKDLRKGDIIAWGKRNDPNANEKKKRPSGQIMIVADRPSVASEATVREGKLQKPKESEEVQVDKFRFVTVPVIDCSANTHFPPETLPPHAKQKVRDGVGKGSVRLILDSSGAVIGYWEGTYSGEHNREITKPTYTDLIGMVRAVSE